MIKNIFGRNLITRHGKPNMQAAWNWWGNSNWIHHKLRLFLLRFQRWINKNRCVRPSVPVSVVQVFLMSELFLCHKWKDWLIIWYTCSAHQDDVLCVIPMPLSLLSRSDSSLNHNHVRTVMILYLVEYCGNLAHSPLDVSRACKNQILFSKGQGHFRV